MTAMALDGLRKTQEWAVTPGGAHLGLVRHIAVFRALVLGDMLCAVPALKALRGCFPEARITLVGLPWAQAWVRRLPFIDRFIAFPGYPGLPEIACDVEALPEFTADMQGERFDLAVQLHGSGGIVNPMIATWGARHVAAFHEPGGFCPEPALSCPWPEQGTEVERLLRLTDVLGAPRRGLALEFPLLPVDRMEAQALLISHAIGQRRSLDSYVCVHPGAQLPSRRWSPTRFAQVADALYEQGHTVVLTGTPGEAELGRAIQQAMHWPAINLVGRTSLWTFGALIDQAQLLVCNDTGASHVAAALGTKSVVISCGSDVSRWAPADRQRHRVLWADRDCRPCSFKVCPHEHGCADDVATSVVWDVVQTMAGGQIAAADVRPPP